MCRIFPASTSSDSAPMLVVEVDVVGREPLQGAVHGDPDAGGAAVQAVASGMGHQAELRCQHHLVASTLQGAGEQFLVDIRAIDLGGVDQRYAQVDGAVNCADGFRIVKTVSDIGHRHTHGTKTEAAYLQAGQVSVLDGTSPCSG